MPQMQLPPGQWYRRESVFLFETFVGCGTSVQKGRRDFNSTERTSGDRSGVQDKYPSRLVVVDDEEQMKNEPEEEGK